jgi:hypothetical protein
MGSWNDILNEVKTCPQAAAQDFVRRQYLRKLSEKTKRNVIAYYSAWLQKPGIRGAELDDADKSGFMATIYQLDCTKGLDLILHTPGGQVAACESIVNYLRKMFDGDIVAYVPQIAMSAGTMIACGCKQIVMGKHSNLGPIDPQFNGIPAYGVTKEFERAMSEVKDDKSRALIWQFIIGKYHPTFIGECENAIQWSQTMVAQWLETGMFKEDPNPKQKAKEVADSLSNKEKTLTHSRHLEMDDCQKIGLNIKELENDQDLQDIVLSIHHAYMITFSQTHAIKIIENHDGKAFVLQAQPMP